MVSTTRVVSVKIIGPETSLRNYRYTLLNSPKDCVSHLFGGGSPKITTANPDFTFWLRVAALHETIERLISY